MHLKQFIIEQAKLNEAKSEGDFTIESLSDKEWVNWVKQHCSDYLPRASNHPIYRGFETFEIVKLGIKDTNEFARRSKGSVPNYYTLWMDNAPQWRGYPKRSRSFIGSSNYSNARNYGLVYQLFPANDAKIGICPSYDIWVSFGEVPGGGMNDFAYLLKNTFKKIYGDVAAARAEVDWTELKWLLELTNFNEFLKINKIDATHAKFTQMGYSKLIDYFEEEIVPWKHGFQRATPANYSLTEANKREVWVQGKVALINADIVFNLNFNRRLFPETSELKEFLLNIFKA